MSFLDETPGVCRFCGCTFYTPCVNLDTQDTCHWLDESNETVCSSPTCEQQWNDLLSGAIDHPQRLPL